jgi:hypothetical protein
MHTAFRTPQRWAAALCGSLALLATAGGQAAPVAVAFSAGSSAVHEYFVADPTISAQAQVQGYEGSWNLDTGVAKRVTVGGVWLGTGPAVPGCCAAEAHDLVFDLTVGGITQAMTARVQATEISNDQYQFDFLTTPSLLFDLSGSGAGWLSVRLSTNPIQLLANTGLYEAVTLFAMAEFVDAPQGVPLPGTLVLVLLGLTALGCSRRGARLG